MSVKSIVLILICALCAYVIYNQFFAKSNPEAYELIEKTVERATDWFEEKNVQEIESIDMDLLYRQNFIDNGFEITKFFSYSGRSDFKSVFSTFKDKKGLHIRDSLTVDENGFEEFKKYIKGGGFVYFETFPFYSEASEDLQDRIDYYLKQIKAGKIAVVCFQGNLDQMVGKSNNEILELQYVLVTDKNPEVFSAKIKQVIDEKKKVHSEQP